MADFEKPFVRVKDKRTKHEFDVTRTVAESNENYELLPKEGDSWSARPPKPHTGTAPKSSPAKSGDTAL